MMKFASLFVSILNVAIVLANTSDLCDGEDKKAVIFTIKGKVTIFKGSQYWQRNEDSTISDEYPKNIADDFPGLPSDIDAAFECDVIKATTFFKNGKYWRLNHAGELSAEQEMSSTFVGIPEKLDAALAAKDNQYSYFFAKGQSYKFDWHTTAVVDGYPKQISEDWPGVPDDLTSAITFEDTLETYFFNKVNYWRWNYADGKAENSRLTKENWFSC